jgi:hypothetical protein
MDLKGIGCDRSEWTYLAMDKSGYLSWYSDGLRAGRLGFDSRHGKISLFSIASRPALESTQPPIQWVPGAIPTELKRLGLEADHSPPSSAEVKNGGSIPPLHHITSWHSA